MELSEKHILREIDIWEKKLQKYRPNDVKLIYDKWLRQSFARMNSERKAKFFRGLDNLLFYTHTVIQGATVQKEAREEIIASGRIFDPKIEKIQDLQQLRIDERTYLANQQASKAKWNSMIQGGITGTGHLFLLGIDFPVMIVMNLRTIQLIGLTFGYEMNHPYEMMLSLQLFHAATLPSHFKKQAWENLHNELTEGSPFLYEGKEELTDYAWLNQPLKQLVKSLFILTAKRKVLQGVPVLSIGVGAYMNHQLTSNVTDFALKFYQKRSLTNRS